MFSKNHGLELIAGINIFTSANPEPARLFIMNNTINTDQPKSLKEHDRFQRYEFSKRIARLIDMNSSERSLVIGLYGKWGEGKTTVMNFIKRELPENCIVINFNPWFFSDQEKLIKAFFDTIAYELKLSIKTKKENIGKVLSDYGSVIGNVTKLAGISLDGVKEMGDKLNQVSTEELKGRVDGVIRASGKKIVVCVDDIDRLDVREVQCIFKLVKLVGDFCNTAYILAFDDEMVAGALAPLYGDGKTNNGYQFLEKIIQVPLKIPKAIKPALRDYTNEMLDNVFQDMELTLTMDEVNRYRNVFDENFLPVIDNPRLAIRYANALFFSLPLLVGEVCTTDVMLVEGLKVLFPGAYEFMRMNSALFITDNMRDRKSMFAGSPDKGTITTETGQFLAGFDKKQESGFRKFGWLFFLNMSMSVVMSGMLRIAGANGIKRKGFVQENILKGILPMQSLKVTFLMYSLINS
ncbi:KAP family NTPase [Mucilaginibacter sp. SMC90]|uniref:KAP family P-loop NTPase fold protein n=1 Tax=Mucilaginibacter sp. SMC90 TaxID=2929803 RepID=UPI001FB27EA6|nr:KAP family NTPase [Mucilaginibacter sp. SMC90]UOE47900.1 KAP family NTPase [Mucilaginibacter sp. SMC90]